VDVRAAKPAGSNTGNSSSSPLVLHKPSSSAYNSMQLQAGITTTIIITTTHMLCLVVPLLQVERLEVGV
jgi:hypothetical protein